MTAKELAFHAWVGVLHGASTMVRLQLDERQWRKVEVALGAEERRGRRGRDDRNFVEAVLWWRRTGVPWRDLPSDFGPWKTVFNRFDRWARTGVWGRLLARLSQDPLCRLVGGFIQKLQPDAHIQERCRLRRGPPGRQVVPALVELGVLARTLGKIEHD
jgi:transposase